VRTDTDGLLLLTSEWHDKNKDPSNLAKGDIARLLSIFYDHIMSSYVMAAILDLIEPESVKFWVE